MRTPTEPSLRSTADSVDARHRPELVTWSGAANLAHHATPPDTHNPTAHASAVEDTVHDAGDHVRHESRQ
ncbi:hypothetical protein [Prescottella soli]